MLTPDDLSALPVEEYAFPGPVRDALVTAILNGTKTSTTSLVAQYGVNDERLPTVGDRGVVIDSEGTPVCVTEVTDVRLSRLVDLDLAHARDEGEGYESVVAWRAGHEEFWHSREFREAMSDSLFAVTDDTEVVLVRFRVVDRLVGHESNL